MSTGSCRRSTCGSITRGCSDDEILDLGTSRSPTSPTPTHFTKSMTRWCAHDHGPGDLRLAGTSSSSSFFRRTMTPRFIPASRPTRVGVADVHPGPAEHLRAPGWQGRRVRSPGLVLLRLQRQLRVANHEADWEHMTVSIASDLTFVSVFFATHGNGHRFDDPASLSWVDGTHVVGTSRTAATRRTPPPARIQGPMVDDHCYDGGPTWARGITSRTSVRSATSSRPDVGAATADDGARSGRPATPRVRPARCFQAKWDTANEYPRR